ncbi:hypothetical protein AB0H43_27990 [Hamadaea sp. NPDC050747]|uniref:hypothetical protein n=1 Tax=Hamadaea sp. NPDC050747 TaxID=3155789 RepID=UPI0033F8165A
MRAIMAGGLPGWGTLRPEEASAWKSPGTDKVYFIAIRFRAENLGPETGVWVSDSLSADRELLMSLDEAALRATTWPNASTVDTSFGPTMTGVKEAKACLGP